METAHLNPAFRNVVFIYSHLNNLLLKAISLRVSKALPIGSALDFQLSSGLRSQGKENWRCRLQRLGDWGSVGEAQQSGSVVVLWKVQEVMIAKINIMHREICCCKRVLNPKPNLPYLHSVLPDNENSTRIGAQ